MSIRESRSSRDARYSLFDSNSAWIGEQLAASGIDSYEHRVVGDNQARIVAALRDLLSRSDAVLICGGLGPTQDDLTRDAIAELMGVPLVRQMELAEHIASMFGVSCRRNRMCARPKLSSASFQRPTTQPDLFG